MQESCVLRLDTGTGSTDKFPNRISRQPFFLPHSPFVAVDHISFVAGTNGSQKIRSEQEIVYNHIHGGPNFLV